VYAYSRIQLTRSFDRKVLLIFSAIVLDALATMWLMLVYGYGEVNPALNWVAENWSPSGMAIAKIAWSLALMSIVMIRKEFHKYIDYLVIGYFILYTFGWASQLIWEVIR